ncbi:Glucose 1-dehydrogenase 2 [Seiridium cupressi]
MTSKLYAIVIGAGPGTGRASAIRFSKAYPVVLLARSSQSYEATVKEINGAGGKAIGVNADTSSVESLTAAFDTIKKELPDHKLAAAVFNPSSRPSFKPFVELKAEDLENNIDVSIRGFFHFAQKTLPLLEEAVPTSKYPPTLIVTGATASVRGSANFAAFAAGKRAKRGLTQSIAREYQPKGVHVAHAIIDGVIDIPRTEHYEVNGGVEDGKISPDSVSSPFLRGEYGRDANIAKIAETYWNLHTQHRSGLTWEVDIRPFVEKW